MHFLKIQNLKLQKVETCLRNFVTEKKQVLGYCRNSQNTPLVVLQGSLYNLTNISARGFTDGGVFSSVWYWYIRRKGLPNSTLLRRASSAGLLAVVQLQEAGDCPKTYKTNLRYPEQVCEQQTTFEISNSGFSKLYYKPLGLLILSSIQVSF